MSLNPISTFRSLRDIARRRPLLVTVAGLGLLGEAGRVGWALHRGAAVTLFGHSGGEVWDARADAVWVGAYVGWVALCGVIVVWHGLAGRRAARVETMGPVAFADAKTAQARAKAGPTAAPSGGAVLWRRR